MTTAMRLVRDRLFWLALFGALPVWALLWIWQRPVFEPVWPLAQPMLATQLPRRWGPLTAANLLTSLLFTGFHFFFHPPLWAAAVLLPSLLFGYFRERHDGLA